LRKKGFVIEHGTIPGRVGVLASKYRLRNPPPPSEIARLVDPVFDETLARDEIPRDELHRYRIYRMRLDELDLLATASSPEDVGNAIVTLGKEGEFAKSCVGILDTHGTDSSPGEWVINPFDADLPSIVGQV